MAKREDRGLYYRHAAWNERPKPCISKPRECVSEAIANLEKFALVGCLERLEAFVSQFEARYGVKLDVPRLQTNPGPPSLQAAQINDALRQRVEEMFWADMRVYQYALSLRTTNIL